VGWARRRPEYGPRGERNPRDRQAWSTGNRALTRIKRHHADKSPDGQLPGGQNVHHQGGASVLLWAIALTLFSLWLLALRTMPVSIYVHLPLVAANVVMLIRVIRGRRVA